MSLPSISAENAHKIVDEATMNTTSSVTELQGIIQGLSQQVQYFIHFTNMNINNLLKIEKFK